MPSRSVKSGFWDFEGLRFEDVWNPLFGRTVPAGAVYPRYADIAAPIQFSNGGRGGRV
jgi:hypothetical protein